LLGTLEALLGQTEPAGTLALWRLFWARLDWLNARLKARRFLGGDQPGPADAALAAILGAYPADLRDFHRLRRHHADQEPDPSPSPAPSETANRAVPISRA
jgi:glutathione S-transferase